MLLAQGLRDSGRRPFVEGPRHPERHPDRAGRQGPRLHQRQEPGRCGVREQQLHHHVHQGRHDQEDQTGGLLASAPERRERHRHPRGRPADRGQAHQRQRRGDDRRPRRQGHPFQRIDGASDRACRRRSARHLDRGRGRGGRHDLRGTRFEAGRAGIERERLWQAYRSGRIPHHQPRRKGREDHQHYGKDRQTNFDTGRYRRQRPDDHQPFGTHHTHRCQPDPPRGPRYAGRAYHQPPRGRRHCFGDGRAGCRGRGGSAARGRR